ncbi:MAG: DUF2905 domain-containing protein [Rhodocyclaceae bacterium]|nr:DUF2905 domain-containing protein [Rhodocyclaceae bacterium]
MLKWLLALLITVFVAGVFLPRLAARLGLRRLPGDVSFRFRGRLYHFPFASALLLSLLATLLLRLF